jgi:AraC-like DNA-binding protein
MEYRSYHPGPPLDGFVENLWSLSDAPPHARERILPSGTLEMVINLHEDEFRIYDAAESRPPKRLRGAIISGAYRGPFVIDTEAHASVIGVHFAPGGARPFLGAAPGHLADAHLDLETLWPRQASELRERLCEAQSPARRFRILENALVAQLRHPLEHHGAVRAALEHIARPGVAVADVADRVGLSHRRLIELFTAEVGVPPKLFGRLQRFQRAVAYVQEAPSVDWAELAVRCGYYDQSHLIRDFGEFSGFSPADLLRHRSDRVKVSHVALPDRARSNLSNTM